MNDGDSQAITRAALEAAGVVRLADGAALFLDGPVVEIRVVVRAGRELPQVADDIRANVRELVGDRPVDVVIADIEPELPPVGVVDVTDASATA